MAPLASSSSTAAASLLLSKGLRGAGVCKGEGPIFAVHSKLSELVMTSQDLKAIDIAIAKIIAEK